MNTITTLLEKISNAKDLDFATIFSESIELFKKTWVQGFLMQLFILVIMLPFILVLYVPLIVIFIGQARDGNYNPGDFDSFFAGFTLIYILFIVAGIVVLSAVSVALNAAFFRIMKALDEGKEVKTSDFFYFLNGKYLSKAFLLIIVSILISIPAVLLCYLPIFYVLVPLSYFTLFFAFNPELSIGEIVKASFSLGHKKWLLSFGLIIVCSFLASIVGFLLCGIGALFTSAFVYHPVYLIYKNVIGFDNRDKISTIGEVNE